MELRSLKLVSSSQSFFLFFLIRFSKVRRKISRSENSTDVIILSSIERARFVFHLYFAWFSMKDLKICKNRILGGEKKRGSKRKIIRRRQGVGAEGCSGNQGDRIEWRGEKRQGSGSWREIEGIERGVPLVRRPRARALTDQMYVLQPDNGPSRTSSGSPAALLDLVEAIVSRAFSLGPLPPYCVRCPHMATYRASKTEKKKKKSIGIQNNRRDRCS